MSDSIIISTKGLKDWQPYEGDGPAALLQQEGEYKVIIKKAKPEISKESKNAMIACVVQVLDEDAAPRGATLYLRTVVSGTDKKGEPNVRHLGDLLYSACRTQAQVRQLEEQERLDLDVVCKSITADEKNIAYVSVSTEEYQGQYRSRANWIRPERYEEQKKGNAHRRPLSVNPAAPRQPAAPAADHVANGARVQPADRVASNI